MIGIPVYNECVYIDAIMASVHEYGQSVLVVDDGSMDGTGKQLDRFPWLHRITHKVNIGYGQSIIDIFAYALEHHYQWVITMDCDHQHQPSCLPRFFERIEKDDVDVISGSRYLLCTEPENVPCDRLRINRYITALLYSALRIDITDAFCGFKAYRVKALRELKLTEKGYGLPLQLWIQAVFVGFRITEIPVPLIYHDPKRNFDGLLELPDFRIQYYMDVIEKELANDGYQNAEKCLCS